MNEVDVASAKELNGVLEHRESLAVFGLLFSASPKRVVRGKQMPLGMWHQSKDATAFITKPRQIEGGSVRIRWKRQNAVAGRSVWLAITQGDLLLQCEPF